MTDLAFHVRDEIRRDRGYVTDCPHPEGRLMTWTHPQLEERAKRWAEDRVAEWGGQVVRVPEGWLAKDPT